MPVTLLQSQLEAIEQLDADEKGTVFGISDTPPTIAAAVAHWLTETIGSSPFGMLKLQP